MKDLSLYMLDLTQNSIRAGASHMIIEVNSQPAEDMLSFSLEDNGSGMDEATVERVQNPFYTTRTTRKVGLGIPLFKEGTELVRSCGKLLDEAELQVKMVMTAQDGTPVLEDFAHDA